MLVKEKSTKGYVLLDMIALAPEIFKEPGEIFSEMQCHSRIMLLRISRKNPREIPDYNNPKKFLLNSSSHAIPPFFMLIVANSQNLREISIKKTKEEKKFENEKNTYVQI